MKTRLLTDLIIDETCNRLSCLLDGREYETLKNDSLVQQIINAIIENQLSLTQIEIFLDNIFESLTPGERFPYTESVMALLFALAHAKPLESLSVLKSFAESKKAETARISRFSERLLKEMELTKTQKYFLVDCGRSEYPGDGLRLARKLPDETGKLVEKFDKAFLRDMGLKVELGDEIEITVRIISRVETRRVKLGE